MERPAFSWCENPALKAAMFEIHQVLQSVIPAKAGIQQE